MRLVVDTNVLISSALKASSWPSFVVRWIGSRGKLLKSEVVDQELFEVLQRPRIAWRPGLNHGAIQSQVAMLLGLHLRTHRPSCRVMTSPGVIPHLRAQFNHRVPDLGVSCAPFTGARSMADPVLLVEILSPSNAAKTRANAWAYATIPSVQEVLILSGAAIRAEILRQGDDTPAIMAGPETLRLHSIGYEGCLAEFQSTTDLT